MGVGRVRDDCSSLRRAETDPAAAAAVPASAAASGCAVNDAIVNSSTAHMIEAPAAVLNRLRCGCMLVACFATRLAVAVCIIKTHMQDSWWVAERAVGCAAPACWQHCREFRYSRTCQPYDTNVQGLKHVRCELCCWCICQPGM